MALLLPHIFPEDPLLIADGSRRGKLNLNEAKTNCLPCRGKPNRKMKRGFWSKVIANKGETRNKKKRRDEKRSDVGVHVLTHEVRMI